MLEASDCSQIEADTSVSQSTEDQDLLKAENAVPTPPSSPCSDAVFFDTEAEGEDQAGPKKRVRIRSPDRTSQDEVNIVNVSEAEVDFYAAYRGNGAAIGENHLVLPVQMVKYTTTFCLSNFLTVYCLMLVT